MTDATKFQYTSSSVPKAYDTFFVPRIFEPWAKLLLNEANLQMGEAVLDIATGPGTVARLAAAQLGPKGRVVAVDIAQPMLDIARSKPPLADAASIEYVQSAATPLSAATGAFDAVLCQQGLQFFPDKPGALREMYRVLKPNGRAAIAVWAEIERNPIFVAYHAALRATVPSELAELATAPFSFPSGTVLMAAIEHAGFREVRLLTPTLPMVFEAGLDQAIQSFAATPVAPSVAALPQDVQEAFAARVRHEMTPLLRDGKVIGEMNSNIVVAYR
ncbi:MULTISPECIES: class I SAM-dependent methyltransferase [unclassified Bradyrhizobium]|uniref:class I SAM-dependent methyltransferase n=1 Tax=unclassified Bradyrhizobium TaxID=2631580 RepID=UPI0013E110BA|nr:MULTISPECIES: class I SAM-dependent methyltransferase [unclassified Bradyrhizobium]QIG97379.1 class I SAM-dependent methyltransferase [Bradyrhizobium sp. 6(2017)]